jgi:Protein of unknown function DUF58
MRPTWRVYGAVALFLVLEWYGATSEVSWLFLLAGWIGAMVIVAAVYAFFNRGALTLRLATANARPSPESPAHDIPEQFLRSAPYPLIFEGDSFDLMVGLDTRKGERGPAWVTGWLGDVSLALGAGVVPRAGWRRPKPLRSLRRAAITSSGWTIHTGDPLGFFRGTTACPDVELGVVMPKFGSLEGGRQTRELEASAAAPRAGAGTELFGVREYSPGDSLRRIHWRSTARQGRLVVREYEPPGVETLAIFLDPAPKSEKVGDQLVRIAASEAWDCIRDGGRVIVWAPGLRATRPAGARDVWALLDWLARYPGEAGDDPVPVASDVVLVTAGADGRLTEALEGARRHGARVRAWVVGDAELDIDVAVDRAGLEWPL